MSYGNQIRKLVLAIIAGGYALFPKMALAFSLNWQSDPDDKSIEYLGQIFGKIGTVLYGAGTPIFGDLFSVFNTAIIFLGSMIIIYTVGSGVLETAQEGEVLGRRWSTAWIPLRTTLGVSFLIPTKGGFSLLQIAMMWVVMQGIHGGNAVYRTLLDTVESGVGLTKEVVSESGDNTFGSLQLFKSLVCMSYINNTDDLKAQIGGNIEYYTNNGHLYVGIPGTKYSSLCGGLSPSSKPVFVSEQSAWHSVQEEAGISAVSTMALYAEEAFLFKGQPNSFTGMDIIATARSQINSIVASAPTDFSPEQTLKKTLENAKRDGWIFTGSYYFKLLDPIPEDAVGAKVFYAPNGLSFDKGNAPFEAGTWSDIESVAQRYLTVTDLAARSTEEPRTSINLEASSSLEDELYTLFKPITVWLQEVALSISENIIAPSDPNEEPLVSMAKLGAHLIEITETAWISLLVIAMGVALVGCISAAVTGLCFMILGALSLMSTVVTFMLALFWMAGISLALYVPLIPFLVFFFSAISWFMLVIESMIAAPIVALGLIAPAGDFLGKASPAVLLMTNIFLRPALMVVGFVVGSKLLIAILRMFHWSFTGTVIASQSYLGLFGVIVLVVLYAGLVIMIVHESFSLIYVLPDKVLRWIGGQAEQSIAAKRVKEVEEQYVDKGAAIAKDVMKSTVSYAVQKAKAKIAKEQKKGPTDIGDITT